MGNLLELVRKARTRYKLSKGRCASCGAILPDLPPFPAWQACSEECAAERWHSVNS